MYLTVDEKRDMGKFEYYRVAEISELCRLLEKYQDEGYCFRGQQNALWEILSAAQRKWKDWTSREYAVRAVEYQHYLSMALEYAKQKVCFLNSDCEGQKHKLRDHERWGFLQHYSWPTPFIDFSSNMDVALFMAVRGLSWNRDEGHFSIYAIRPVFADGDENIDLDEWVQNHGGGDEEFYCFHKWCQLHTWIMHKNSGSWCPEISYGRMASQGGMFVYLNAADKSLEEEFSQTNRFVHDETKRIDGLWHNRIVCIDVPCRIASEIKAYLLDKGISASKLGLDDQSRDNEIMLHYSEFEKFFIGECNSLLGKKISRANHSFFRTCGEDFLALCPRSGASVLINGGWPLERELRNGLVRGVDLVAAMAAHCNSSFGEVLNGIGPVLREMNHENLIDFLENENVPEDVCSASIVPDEKFAGSDESLIPEDAVAQFYNGYHLPMDVHIDLTDACTERCVHCYVPKGLKDYLPVELVEKALVEFRAMNGLTVHLTGGEAMMHPDFERICRKCVELNLNFIIFSNMTLCDDKRIAFLKEVQPQFINVSLYSMDPTVHDAITQLPGSWQRTHDAVVMCCEAGVACRIATPLLKENQDALPALRKFADEHRMHLVPAADIIAQADHGCGNLAHACSTEELRRVMTRDHDLFHKVYDSVMPACDAKVCDIGAGRLYLNAKGNYYPCDSMHEYVLGNVRENTIEEVWKGEKLNYLRGLKNRDFGSCATCRNRPWCKVCPAANFNATGNLFKHHPSTCALAGVLREVYGE